MFSVSLLVPFIFLFLVFQKSAAGWRSSLLASAIVWGLVLTAITEALSPFRLITFGWILGAWTFAGITSFFIYLSFLRTQDHTTPARVPTTPLSPFSLSLLLSTAFIAVIVGLIALIAAPNNGDSMSYHLARVIHWIQNQSVAHYPTSTLRQLYLNPWSEFALMHLQLLSSGDRLANLVQWFSMVGSLVGVSLIANQLGADARGQISAVVVCATIPMGILQASSTQNDYAVTFWLVCFVYYLMFSKEHPGWVNSLLVGASLGLAILTKATAYIYALPFLVWFGLSSLKALRWRLWKPIVIIAVAVVSINLGHYTRNFDLFSSPIRIPQADAADQLANEVFTPSSFFSNTTRNITMHFSTPIASVNAVTERATLFLHTLLGIDINDPRTTWLGREFHILKLSSSQNEASNPIHLLLILLSLLVAFIYGGKSNMHGLRAYALALTFAFLFFCLYLKWQPYHSRLHLPLFVLWSPFIAIVLSRIPYHKIAKLIPAILLVSVLPWVFYNNNHPLTKRGNILYTARTEQYFSDSPELREPYAETTDFLKSKGCRDIGLSFGWDSREYPLWIILREKINRSVRIEHINVNNISAIKQNTVSSNQFNPCAILSDNSGEHETIITERGSYVRVFSSGTVGIFVLRK